MLLELVTKARAVLNVADVFTEFKLSDLCSTH